MRSVNSDLATKDITVLDLDHPGARDPVYRARRDFLAALAVHHRRNGLEAPDVTYTDEENATWCAVTDRLNPLHEKYACRIHVDARHRLGIPDDHIPQLRELSERLQRFHGFRLRAIEGLIEPKIFLGGLADHIMFCTQYIRHHSRPEYTPEPDIVHEVIGHVPMFADPDFVKLSLLIGKAAVAADDRQITFLDRLYWYTLEFGLIEEAQGIRAYGAGLLSSFGELSHAFTPPVEHRAFDMEEVVSSPYDYSDMQPVLFVVPSFAYLCKEVETLLNSGRW
jgi:monomeric phenylalanine-4-hydroxylase